jgi:Ca2+-binding EF-hand superfamily protein
MGCGKSKLSVHALIRSISKWKEQFEALGLRESDVALLHRSFTNMQPNGSGEISIQGMLKYFHLHDCEFMKKAFSVLNTNETGSINFREYIFVLWNFQTLGSNFGMM